MTTQQSEIGVNPFAVKTPENLSAEEIVNLFVPYAEFENLQVGGHQFLHGHRGSGKSMMLRMMSPDSQILWRKCEFHELPYFGVYLSIKATELNAPEYKRLENEIGGTVLSEHVLTTKLLSALFLAVDAHCVNNIATTELENILRQDVVIGTLFSKLKYAGWSGVLPESTAPELVNAKEILKYVIKLVDEIHISSVQYIKRRSFMGETHSYQGVLLGFQDVLLPVAQALSASNIIPKAPIYFLLDDADNLTEQQTQILNTWVSYRTTGDVSLKISTQLNYKTYKTTSGIKIEAPHDFSSIDFTSVRTGSVKERYPELVADIVKKRLARYGVQNTDPYVFFPQDESQEKAIKEISDEIKLNWKPGESGYRPEDDAYRFARPEYIRRLSGVSKQGARYKYAGFEQLVHVSSGIIRFFLEPASRMFTEQLLKNNHKQVVAISPTIQDQELRKQADQLLLHEFAELENEAENNTDQSLKLNDVIKLKNLVQGIGALFKAHIMDENISQRRVFSFTISGEPPSKELKSILKLGVIYGYFYLDSIGSKTGLGRETLYVLSRRLAPAFSLDPIGFSNHLSLSSKFLLEISERPQAYISRLKRKGVSSSDNSKQVSLFDGDDDE